MSNADFKLNITEEFKKRIYWMHDNPDSSIFASFSEAYSNNTVLAYVSFVFRQIGQKPSKTIFYIGDQSVESLIITFFLLISNYQVYILPSDFRSGTKLCNELLKINNQYLYLTHGQIEPYFKTQDHLSIISLDQFVKDVHPVSNTSVFLEKYFRTSFPFQAKIFSSSGSTGTPKLIPLNINNINACFNACHSHFLSDINYQDIICLHSTSFVIVLPYLFAFLSCKNLPSIKAVSQRKPLYPLFQYGKHIDEQTACLIISVPTMLKSFYSIVNESKLKFSGLNLISCGEPLAASLTENLLSLNPASFHNLYGCTEVSPWILALDILEFSEKFPLPPILPVGVPLPNVNCRINDKGELLINSPSVFTGYLNHDNSYFCHDSSGLQYFNTSDLFEIADKFYFCKGRNNNVVKLAGTYVNSTIIEAILRNYFSYEDIIVVANIDTSTLRVIICNCNAVDNCDFSKQNIRSVLQDQLSSSVILSIELNVSPPERLSSGKINRKYYMRDAN